MPSSLVDNLAHVAASVRNTNEGDVDCCSINLRYVAFSDFLYLFYVLLREFLCVVQKNGAQAKPMS